MDNPTISVALIISLVSVTIAVVTFFRNINKDTKTDSQTREREMSDLKEALIKANIKLDQVCATTSETRTDIKATNLKIQELDKELAVIKRDISIAFNRIDAIESSIVDDGK